MQQSIMIMNYGEAANLIYKKYKHVNRCGNKFTITLEFHMTEIIAEIISK